VPDQFAVYKMHDCVYHSLIKAEIFPSVFNDFFKPLDVLFSAQVLSCMLIGSAENLIEIDNGAVPFCLPHPV
jgi:hypothetical protein